MSADELTLKALLVECDCAVADAIYYADKAAKDNEGRHDVASSGHRKVAERFRDLRKRIAAALHPRAAA